MTDQIVDVQTYLNRQQQQERMRQQVEAITPSQEEVDHAAVQHAERTAQRTAAECHETVSQTEDQLLEVSSHPR